MLKTADVESAIATLSLMWLADEERFVRALRFGGISCPYWGRPPL
jgi:hypothetical protein